MKKKEIDRCVRINLSTSSEDMMRTIRLENTHAKYSLCKILGGNDRMNQYIERMRYKAMTRKTSLTSDLSEWISPKGNRWISYVQFRYYKEADYVRVGQCSFIYYETYGSCGAFVPISNVNKGDGEEKTDGVMTFTSHFFMRLADRTGIPLRSRELIVHFIESQYANQVWVDDDGKCIRRFEDGYGHGVCLSNEPFVIEMRTFIHEKQLSNTKLMQYKQIDDFDMLYGNGLEDKMAAFNFLNKLMDGDKDCMELTESYDKAIKRLGIQDILKLAGMFEDLFMRVLFNIIGKEFYEVPNKYKSSLYIQTVKCFFKLAEDYRNTDIESMNEVDKETLLDKWGDCAVNAASKIEMWSISKQEFTSRAYMG